MAVFLRVDTVSLEVAVESDSPLSGCYGNYTLFGDWYRKDYQLAIKAGVCAYNCRYRISNLELHILNIETRTADIEFRISNCTYWMSKLEQQIFNLESRTADIESRISNRVYWISNLKTADIESRMMPSGFSSIVFSLICQTSTLIIQSTNSKFSRVWWNMCVHLLAVTQWFNPLNFQTKLILLSMLLK